MDSVRLVARIVQCFRDVGLCGSQPQLQNLALLCYALAFGRDCHLANLALELPLVGRRSSLEQRLQRSLRNGRFAVHRCYAPLGRQLLANWSGAELCLVLDRTDIKDEVSLLLVGAAYHKRLLPLTWHVLRFGATGAAEQLPLLQRVLPWLPPQGRVCFYADSEFRTLEVQRWCQQQHWHWQVGLHNSLLFKAPDDAWQSLKSLGLQPGARRYLQNVWLGGKEAFGPVNLIADWAPSETAPHYWAVDLPADPQAWRRGRKRYWIEPTFRDWKSYGFDLEASHIRDVDRLEHLLLGMALTTVWLLHIGEWLTHSGRRYELARRTSDYSLFRLGRDYLARTRTVPGHIPVGLTLAGWA
jgi:hypothetical protein